MPHPLEQALHGLKELLSKYGFTLNELLNMQSSELA
jgi:hypothetical protein